MGAGKGGEVEKAIMPRFTREGSCKWKEAVAGQKVPVFAVLWAMVKYDHGMEGIGRVAESMTPEVEPPP